MAKIKIGIVGLNFGEYIINLQLREGPGRDLLEITAVCDLDKDLTAKLSEELGMPGFADIDEMLAKADLDAVGLFTGPGGRAELIGKIIRAGKHVMTTKPFERSSQKARAILQEAKSLGKVVHLNSPSPLLSKAERVIKGWQEKYQLGAPVGSRCDIWADRRQEADGSWYDDPEMCPVAPIYRIGIYQLNTLMRIFGEPDRVQVFESRLFTGRPTSDNAQMGVLFKNGAIANIFCSYAVRDGQQYKNQIIMNFENGTVYRDMAPLQCYDENHLKHMLSVYRLDEEGKKVSEHAVVECESYQWEAFCGAVRGEKLEGEIDSEEIVMGVKVMEAMARASKSGRTEKV